MCVAWKKYMFGVLWVYHHSKSEKSIQLPGFSSVCGMGDGRIFLDLSLYVKTTGSCNNHQKMSSRKLSSNFVYLEGYVKFAWIEGLTYFIHHIKSDQKWNFRQIIPVPILSEECNVSLNVNLAHMYLNLHLSVLVLSDSLFSLYVFVSWCFVLGLFNALSESSVWNEL